MKNCPLCDAEWGFVMRKPLKNIHCPECLKERERRIDFMIKKKSEELVRREKHRESWEALTKEQKAEQLTEDIKLLYGK